MTLCLTGGMSADGRVMVGYSRRMVSNGKEGVCGRREGLGEVDMA